MNGPVTQEVIDAISSGTAYITRRLEIYESDGETLWTPDDGPLEPRLISGSVGVDYSRSERRSISALLDNRDGRLDHNPDGFWYDKVLKPFRGIRYTPTKTRPSIMIIDAPGDFGYLEFAAHLRRLGYGDIKLKLDADETADLQGYDVIAAYSGNGNFSTPEKLQLLKDAYGIGFSIFTMGVQSAVDIGFYATGYNKPNTSNIGIENPIYDTPVQVGWSNSVVTGTTGNTYVDSETNNTLTQKFYKTDALDEGYIQGRKRVTSFWTVFSDKWVTSITCESPGGARWFHAIPPKLDGDNPHYNQLLVNGIRWLYTPGEDRFWETQVGEFLMDQINEESFPSAISISGRDYTKKLLNDKLNDATIFRAGTSLNTFVRAIAANAGIVKFSLGTANILFDRELAFDADAERWKLIYDACAAFGVEVFFNNYGSLVTREFRDPTLSPTTMTLRTGVDGNLSSFSKSSRDSRIFNYVICVSESSGDIAEGNMFVGIASNTDPTSPTRIEKIGKRVKRKESTLYNSDAQALRDARNLLAISALEEFSLSFTSFVFPWMEGGEVIGFIDPKAGTSLYPDRYLLTDFNIPLGLEPMDGTGKRITIVGPGSAQLTQGTVPVFTGA